MRFEIVTPDSSRRFAVEAMVRNVFANEYGARLSRFPRRMIAVVDDDGQPRCAAGLRDAEAGFFSEQYLDLPLDRVIAEASGSDVRRNAILELGSVAAERPGAFLMLLRGFAHLGIDDGYRWGVFTATARLRRMAARFGILLHDLAPAVSQRVENPQDWGRYYDFDPHVCAVDGLPAGIQLDVSRMPCFAASATVTS